MFARAKLRLEDLCPDEGVQKSSHQATSVKRASGRLLDSVQNEAVHQGEEELLADLVDDSIVGHPLRRRLGSACMIRHDRHGAGRRGAPLSRSLLAWERGTVECFLFAVAARGQVKGEGCCIDALAPCPTNAAEFRGQSTQVNNHWWRTA